MMLHHRLRVFRSFDMFFIFTRHFMKRAKYNLWSTTNITYRNRLRYLRGWEGCEDSNKKRNVKKTQPNITQVFTTNNPNKLPSLLVTQMPFFLSSCSTGTKEKKCEVFVVELWEKCLRVVAYIAKTSMAFLIFNLLALLVLVLLVTCYIE